MGHYKKKKNQYEYPKCANFMGSNYKNNYTIYDCNTTSRQNTQDGTKTNLLLKPCYYLLYSSLS